MNKAFVLKVESKAELLQESIFFLINLFARDVLVKFVFSKKATKIDEIFTVDLTYTT